MLTKLKVGTYWTQGMLLFNPLFSAVIFSVAAILP